MDPEEAYNFLSQLTTDQVKNIAHVALGTKAEDATTANVINAAVRVVSEREK